MRSRVLAGIAVLVLLGGGLWLVARPGPAPEPRAAALRRTGEAPPRAPTLRGAEPASTPAKAATGAAEPDGTGPVAAPAPATRYVIRGRVLDRLTRRGLTGAEVLGTLGRDPRVLRFSHPELRATRTDAQGRYELVFDLATLPAELVLTALAPGYQSPHARPEEEGEVYMEETSFRVAEGGERELEITLLPGLDVAGVVTDEEGTPVAGAEIVLTLETASSTAYLEVLETDAEGRFRIHDLPPRKGTGGAREAAVLSFSEPGHVAARVDDVYALPRPDRAALEVVMRRGLTLRGTLQHVDGTPAPDHLVETFLGGANENRKCAWTDEAGRFEIEGLAAGDLVLRAASATGLSSVRRTLRVLRSGSDVVLRLEPLPLVGSAPRSEILGVEVVLLPPEVRETLGYPDSCALWITGVGDDAPEGLRAHARVGDVLWCVGYARVSSVRDVVAGVLASVDRIVGYDELAGRPPRETYGARIVLGIRRPELDGTNTQGMQVTRAQVDALRSWLAVHPEEE